MQSKITPWRRLAMTVTAMLLVLLLAASFRFVQSRGVFASVADKTPASCRTVAGIGGVAAIAPDLRDSIVYIATRQGAVYQFLDGVTAKMTGAPKDFHPVALSVSHAAHDDARLVAAFRRDDGSAALAIFDVQAGKLVETSRLTTDQLTDPADLVSVDGARFYLVNRHGSHTAFGRWLDDAFLIPRAEILYFDGMKFVRVAERLNSPSGLALSADGANLYVAQGLPRTIVSFTRNDFLGSLDHAALTTLDASPGKLTATKDTLIVAASPKPGTGAVYRVPLIGNVPQTPELLWSSKSESAAAAAETNGHLLIGTEKRLIDCQK